MARLLEAFPGSQVEFPCVTTSPGTTALWRHFKGLWGQSDGYARFAHGSGPHRDGFGKYKHAGWHERYFHWPDDGPKIIEWCHHRGTMGDVYYGPQLREKGGSGSPLLPGCWIWCDVDHPFGEEDEHVMSRFKDRMIVNSGNGFHAYAKSLKRHPADRIDVLNQTLCKELGGDAFSVSGVLRVPGTFNWKGFTTGGRASLVRRVA